jgi:hypothetical protein
MNCSNCGADLRDDTKFCTTCGAATGPPAASDQVPGATDDEAPTPAEPTPEASAPRASATPPGRPPGPPPPGPPPSRPPGPPATPTGGGPRRALLIGLIVTLVLAVGIGAAVLVIAGGDDNGTGTANDDAVTVQTEPISTTTDPFAPAGSVGMDQDIPPVQTDGVVEVEGGHEGLYGGSLNEQVCDKDTLVEFLAENPEKAAAWSDVLGISVDDIPDYIAGLTPLLLRSDTLVTNHGFVDGQATSFAAVLEAGTAVLVDDRGVPVTKCYCGNPLTAPPSTSSPFEFSGPTWDDFSETSLTVIEENETVIEDFIVVDPTTRQGFTRPAGTDGSDDIPTTERSDTDTPTTTSQQDADGSGAFDGTYALEFAYGDDPLRPDVGCLPTPTAASRFAEGTLIVTGDTATLTLPDIRISDIHVGNGGLIDFVTYDPEDVPNLNYLRVILVIGNDGQITTASKWRADSPDHELRCGGPISGQRIST